jgi:inorganic pyrophosphatase
VSSTGELYAVKVVGALAMVDSGELDWKIVAVAVDDPLAQQVDDLAALPKSHALQARLAAVREWFRTYKISDGGKANEFAFDGAYLGRDDALRVVRATHGAWRALVHRAHGPEDELWWVQQPGA